MTILCYVSLPDGQDYQVECDAKCIGQECLDKICRMLCIVVEIDYFGLQFRGGKGELVWLNTKNRLARQIPGAPPYRLILKVKYFASPHVLLQEETRHQFYMNARYYLTQRTWYQTISSELKARFIALMAQAIYGDYSPMTSAEKYFNLWIPPADEYWTSAESNMLGVRKGSCNSVSSVSSCPSNSGPTNQPIEDDVFLPPANQEERNGSRPLAEIANQNIPSHPEEVDDEESKVKFFRLIASFHQELVDLESHSAEYRLIKLAASLPFYGTVFQRVRDCFDTSLLLGVSPSAILITTPEKKLVNKYEYSSVQKITESNRVFFIVVRTGEAGNTSNHPRELGFQLVSQRAASALYRNVTETHCFFCCDTVRPDVLSQMSRGVKGTLTSLLQSDPDSTKGKEYVFDIRVTFRELYDTAKRQFYLSSASANQQSYTSENSVSVPPSSNTVIFQTPSSFSIDNKPNVFPAANKRARHHSGASIASSDSDGSNNSSNPGSTAPVVVSSKPETIQENIEAEVLQLRAELARQEENYLCQVCMENELSRVFSPCGHLVCCGECAMKVDQCPLCRADIKKRCPIFLPWKTPMSFENLDTSNLSKKC